MNNSPQFSSGPKFFYVHLGCKSRRRAIRSIGTNTQISHRRRRQIRRQFDFFLRRTKTPNRRPRKPTIPSPSKNPPAAQRLRPHAARPRLRSAVKAHRERCAEPRDGARRLEAGAWRTRQAPRPGGGPARLSQPRRWRRSKRTCRSKAAYAAFGWFMRWRGGPFLPADSRRNRGRRGRAASWPKSKAREPRSPTARTPR
jgi:hypothetical protein